MVLLQVLNEAHNTHTRALHRSQHHADRRRQDDAAGGGRRRAEADRRQGLLARPARPLPRRARRSRSHRRRTLSLVLHIQLFAGRHYIISFRFNGFIALSYIEIPGGASTCSERFCKMLSESSLGCWAVLQRPCCPSKQGELS